MTYAEQLQLEAKERRKRIAKAAVNDLPIDLKRKKTIRPYGGGAAVRPLVTPASPALALQEPSPALDETPIIDRITKISVNKIIQIISDTYMVDIVDILSERRSRPLIIPRHVAMYLAKKMTVLSYPAIGRMFGHRDHTTILHAFNRVHAKAKANNLFACELLRLEIIIMEAHNGTQS